MGTSLLLDNDTRITGLKVSLFARNANAKLGNFFPGHPVYHPKLPNIVYFLLSSRFLKMWNFVFWHMNIIRYLSYQSFLWCINFQLTKYWRIVFPYISMMLIWILLFKGKIIITGALLATDGSPLGTRAPSSGILFHPPKFMGECICSWCHRWIRH